MFQPFPSLTRFSHGWTITEKTFDYDEQGKWAENEARRAAAVS